MKRLNEYGKRYVDYIESKKNYSKESETVTRAKREFGVCIENVLIYARIFNSIPNVEMNEYQCWLTRNFLPYAIRAIFRKYWGRYSGMILELFKLSPEDVTAYIVASITTRQQGKTFWMTLNTIALMLTAGAVGPDRFDQGFVANRKAICTETIGNLKAMLEQVPYFQTHFRKVKWLQEMVQIERIDAPGKYQNTVEAHSTVSITSHTNTHVVSCAA
jgi:hypothetical protein